jgi:hypothetical protein
VTADEIVWELACSEPTAEDDIGSWCTLCEGPASHREPGLAGHLPWCVYLAAVEYVVDRLRSVLREG